MSTLVSKILNYEKVLQSLLFPSKSNKFYKLKTQIGIAFITAERSKLNYKVRINLAYLQSHFAFNNESGR